MRFFGWRLERGTKPARVPGYTPDPEPELASAVPSDPHLAYQLGEIHARLTALETEIDRLRRDLAATRRSKSRAEDAQELLALKGDGQPKIYRTGDVA